MHGKKIIFDKRRKFGRLRPLEFVGRYKTHAAKWRFKCSCGKTIDTNASNVLKGRIRSCGCLLAEYNKNKGIHHLSGTRFQRIWSNMKLRCYSPKHRSYKLYGGRGIRIEWKSLLEFKKNMYESYIEHVKKYGEKDTTLDRINPNGNYKKDNCRWATMGEQLRNSRRNVYLEYNGERLCLTDMAKRYNIARNSLVKRLKLGWNLKIALTRPIDKRFKNIGNTK